MSTITAKVIVDSNQATAALDKLNSKLKTTSDGFGKLNSLLGGLAIGSFVASAFSLADAMADVAEATELSIQSVMGFSKAVAASGGSIEGAQKSLIKFTENIGDATKGNAGLQESFYQIGVSLEDLKKLSSEDLLKKTIDGLSKVSDVSARLKLQSDLLGKGFKGVNASGVSSTYEELKKGSEASAQASIKAAAAVDKFNTAITTMKTQVLQAIEPIVSAFNDLPVERIAKITKLVVELGLAFGAFKVGKALFSAFGATAGAIIPLFTKSIDGFKAFNASQRATNMLSIEMTKNLLTTGKAGLSLGNTFKDVAITFSGLLRGFKGLIMGVGALVGSFALLVAQIILVNDAVSAITGFDFIDTMAHKLEKLVKDTFPSLHSAIDSLGKKMGMADINGNPQSATIKTGVGTDAPLGGKDAEARATAERDVVDSLDKQRTELSKILRDYKEANDQAFKRYSLETDMIGKSQEQQALMQMRNEKEIEFLNQKKVLQDKIDAIASGSSEMEKSKLIPEITAQIQELTAEYNKQKAAIEGQVAARMKADAANQLAVFTDAQRVSMADSLVKLQSQTASIFLPEINRQYLAIEQSAKAAATAEIAAEEARRGAKLDPSEVEAYYAAATQGVNDLKKATQALNEEQSKWQLHLFAIQQEIDLSNNLNKIQDDMATMTMPEIEKKYYDIAAAARDSAKAAIEAEEARRNAKLSPQEAQAYYDKAYAGTQKLTQATKKQWEMSRSFETGWKKAMNSYITEATNAATKAEKLFTTACKGMEDAIVGFAKTGKFEWKSFVSDMLEQLLRSQVEVVFANLMQSIIGSLSSATSSSQASASQDDSILGMIGSLFSGSGSSAGGIGGAQGSPVYVTNWPTGVSGGIESIFGGGGSGQQSSGGGIWDSITGGISDALDSITGGISDAWDSITGGISDAWDTVTGLFGGTSSGTGAGNAQAGSLWGAPVAAATQDTSWFSDVASSVGDIASSIGDWFGGFFADGGHLPAGKIGIVGERGPEFIGGPANITPMSGSSGSGQSVTNVFNVSTIDAKSFQQWMAQDPNFLAAVVYQGQKGMPA